MVAELARQEKGGAAAHAHANCLNGEEARAIVDSQIWHLLGLTGQTGRVCTVRVELGFL